jgi:hypothetical protein
VEVVGRSSVVPNGGNLKGGGTYPQGGDPHDGIVPTLRVEIPMAAEAASSLQADMDMAVGADARSPDPKAARILLEVVAATWEVHQRRRSSPLHRGCLATMRSM